MVGYLVHNVDIIADGKPRPDWIYRLLVFPIIDVIPRNSSLDRHPGHTGHHDVLRMKRNALRGSLIGIVTAHGLGDLIGQGLGEDHPFLNVLEIDHKFHDLSRFRIGPHILGPHTRNRQSYRTPLKISAGM